MLSIIKSQRISISSKSSSFSYGYAKAWQIVHINLTLALSCRTVVPFNHLPGDRVIISSPISHRTFSPHTRQNSGPDLLKVHKQNVASHHDQKDSKNTL